MMLFPSYDAIYISRHSPELNGGVSSRISCQLAVRQAVTADGTSIPLHRVEKHLLQNKLNQYLGSAENNHFDKRRAIREAPL